VPKRTYLVLRCGLLTLLVVTAVLLRGYFRSPTDRPAEILFFATIGNRPFQDSISSVWPDGSHRDELLTPHHSQSYVAVSGTATSKHFVVAVHQVSANAKRTENHLFLYDPNFQVGKRLITQEGVEGYGAVSPDDSRVVVEFDPQTQADKKREQGRLWIVDPASGEIKKLTTNDEEGTWDAQPAWSPDSLEIIFLRLRLTPQGVLSKLMRVSAQGGEPMAIAEDVADACYAPDGKRLAIVAYGGLQVWDPAKNTRALIVSWSSFPDHKYLAGGLSWSGTLDKIAFSISNMKTNQSELWTVSSNGQDARQLLVENGRVSFPVFVRTR
jgi:Tol biopolymer transport system component